jgi:hypothetical protein
MESQVCSKELARYLQFMGMISYYNSNKDIITFGLDMCLIPVDVQVCPSFRFSLDGKKHNSNKNGCSTIDPQLNNRVFFSFSPSWP